MRKWAAKSSTHSSYWLQVWSILTCLPATNLIFDAITCIDFKVKHWILNDWFNKRREDIQGTVGECGKFYRTMNDRRHCNEKPVQVQGDLSFEAVWTHVLANWIDMSSNNSPTVAMSSGFHSPFGVETPVEKQKIITKLFL